MAHIRIDQADLTFRVRRHLRASFKDYVLRGLFRNSANPAITVRALQNVSLEVREGDRLGLLGGNGAGKSTLLKLVAGIYEPTRGTCITRGRISSLFDLALGFEPDATGWENIAFRCYLQGETPASVRRKSGTIAGFSGLGEHLNMPVRYYSSGMTVRLAFSIATAIDPEILLIDEVLAAGDAEFQQRAARRIEEMMAQSRIMICASHDLASLERLCDRAIWLEQGRVRQVGACAEVVTAYRASLRAASRAAA
jgi:ABC-type polysaccharide/polyol phosphate transport system ATPase subunit